MRATGIKSLLSQVNISQRPKASLILLCGALFLLSTILILLPEAVYAQQDSLKIQANPPKNKNTDENQEGSASTEIPSEAIIEQAPELMRSEWDLIDPEVIRRFVFDPLPEIIKELAEKAPVLKEILETLGVDRLSVMWKARDVDVKIPNLQEAGEIPTDLIYAQDVDTGLDLNVHIVFDHQQFLAPRIKTLPKRKTRLLVKPEEPVESLKGFIALKPPILSLGDDENAESQILNQFTYADPDGDGIYTAEFKTPEESGLYNLVTEYEYQDPTKSPQLKASLLVIPKGYVYEEIDGQENLIREAQVALYQIDPETQQESLWDAAAYGQENPQKTDSQGRYSFFVPPGQYSLRIQAEKYQDYQSEIIAVDEAQGIQEKIKMERTFLARLLLKIKLKFTSLFS